MTNERHLIYPAVYALLLKNNKILLMRRFNTGYKDGFFTLPAGHIEKNELPRETMLRELKEETGLVCDIESAIPVHIMYRIKSFDDRTYIDYFFKILKYSGKLENKEPNKCDYFDWYDIENLPQNILPQVEIVLKHIKNKVLISEMRERN